ncbi:MAG: serine/threonine protein kinase [Gammaproteobacteria bacterium]|nr:serine/threonine protein kinase [Gammaproteobacteria bacterium]MBL6999053.1 serine/threonine protein kinase [Gammaproteobacteria bacterium]
MLVFTGGCFLLSLLLSFNASVESMETGFYQQLLALTPRFNLPQEQTLFDLPNGLQELVLLLTFTLLMAYQYFLKRPAPSMVFVILVIFSLLMLQLLLAVIYQLWVPTVWTILTFCFTALLLTAMTRLQQFRNKRPLSVQQQITAIQQQIEKKNYETAVLMLKNGEFSDDLFEIAYDLGVELEANENWILARYLYVWLVQFDPGLEDFVTRMDYRIHPDRDEDLSTTEITQNKDMIGHYQLVGKKAQGATATVYEAYDLHTHKRIALKMLNQPVDDSTAAGDVLSFLREALTVSRLDHPNIVKIHDADIHNDRAYIAMDYIAGYPMSERLRRKRFLTAAETLRIMKSVLQALVVAHQKNIVHGDIKPANIMYDQHRKLYILTDFGAANKSNQLLDSDKRIVGTPAYMSPEQLSGNRMDGRSDLFSLAVTIYHLLSGIQPFATEKLSELKKNVLTLEVDVGLLSIPDMIKQLLNKALQKKTYLRFADASQMLQAVIYCEQKLKQARARATQQDDTE